MAKFELRPLTRKYYYPIVDFVCADCINFNTIDCYSRDNFLGLRSIVLDKLNEFHFKWSDNIEGVNAITYMVFNHLDIIKRDFGMIL